MQIQIFFSRFWRTNIVTCGPGSKYPGNYWRLGMGLAALIPTKGFCCLTLPFPYLLSPLHI